MRIQKKLFSSWIGCLFLGLMACGDPPQRELVSAPAHLIERDQMIKLMVEMQILEAKVIETARTDKAKAFKVFIDAQKKLMAHHGIDSAQYYESERYYMQQISEYHDMITAVADTIDYMRNNIKEPEESAKAMGSDG
ncbi:MAG: DUF4296 domain-containing protein [Flammeovirgaceae bacterium]